MAQVKQPNSENDANTELKLEHVESRSKTKTRGRRGLTQVSKIWHMENKR